MINSNRLDSCDDNLDKIPLCSIVMECKVICNVTAADIDSPTSRIQSNLRSFAQGMVYQYATNPITPNQMVQ